MSLKGKIKKFGNYIKSFNTRIRKFKKSSDLKRWSKKESLLKSWDTRTKIISEFILPNTKVIEFGAGTLKLKSFIHETVEYTPSDIVDRGENTIVCDLNRPLPQFKEYDYAVFSGVLEYINDVPRLIKHLYPGVKSILASYAVVEKNKENRRAFGWVNDFTEKDFLNVFEAVGYKLKCKKQWRKQLVFHFEINDFEKFKINKKETPVI
ncbi:hypothetical protein EVU94_11310 [Flavobacteriaceae bacterium 144Ye]|nr:hypothetical protein EVU94_11310 [Flavobacteriaceae bacterium 144Ye]